MDHRAAAGHWLKKSKYIGICGSRFWKDRCFSRADRENHNRQKSSGRHWPSADRDVYQCGSGRDAGADRKCDWESVRRTAGEWASVKAADLDSQCTDHDHRQLLSVCGAQSFSWDRSGTEFPYRGWGWVKITARGCSWQSFGTKLWGAFGSIFRFCGGLCFGKNRCCIKWDDPSVIWVFQKLSVAGKMAGFVCGSLPHRNQGGVRPRRMACSAHGKYLFCLKRLWTALKAGACNYTAGWRTGYVRESSAEWSGKIWGFVKTNLFLWTVRGAFRYQIRQTCEQQRVWGKSW